MGDDSDLVIPLPKTGNPEIDKYARRVARAIDILRQKIADGGGAAGTLAGDVTGASDANVVASLDGIPVNVATPSTGDVLTYSGGAIIAAAPSGGPPTGAAGGGLTGTYPNPDVAKVRAVTVSTTPPSAGQALLATGTTAAAWGNPVYQKQVIGSVDFTALSAYTFVQGANSIGDGRVNKWQYGEQNGHALCALDPGLGARLRGVSTQCGIFIKITDLAPTIDFSRAWSADISFNMVGASSPTSTLYHGLMLTDGTRNTTSWDSTATCNTNGTGLIVKNQIVLATSGAYTINTEYWANTTKVAGFTGSSAQTDTTLAFDVWGQNYVGYRGASQTRSAQTIAGVTNYVPASTALVLSFSNLAIGAFYGYDTNGSGTREMRVTGMRVLQ